MIIPGWLGSAQSSYVLSAAQYLWQQGFNVVRVNLRDHGNTAHLNSGLFHSALSHEVIELAKHLMAKATTRRRHKSSLRLNWLFFRGQLCAAFGSRYS